MSTPHRPLADGIPDAWAVEWGEDRHGRFESFAIGDVVYRMRWIAPGRFEMGSPATESGRWDVEGPQHRVALTRGYWLGETLVTQALWSAVLRDNPSAFQSAERPVETVSWEDGHRFIARLNELVPELDARLPTEAEWEHACRAGTSTATWSDDLEIKGLNHAPRLDAIAWYGGNSGVDFDLASGWDSADWPEKQHRHTKAGSRPVRRKSPNPRGLYDMLGNVWEWCEDRYGPYSEAPVVDPLGAPTGTTRVVRGGSWNDPARNVRAAARVGQEPTFRDPRIGLRLARSHLATHLKPPAR